LSSRWSSENNWEDASHYIELEFPEEISVSFVVLKWERRNAVNYALEGSLDGSSWTQLASYDTAPEEKNQEIVLEDAVQTRFLRLSVYEVSKRDEDYSNLYQNVSLYEFEVYADKPAAYQVQAPVIVTEQDGSRRLSEPEAPAGYTASYIGADLEQVIGADGQIYDNIQEKEVTVGYRVQDEAGREEAQEVSFRITVPAYDDAGMPADETDNQAASSAQEAGNGQTQAAGNAQTATADNTNPCPTVIPALQEWKGGTGTYTVTEATRIIVDTATAQTAAELLRSACQQFSYELEILEGTPEDVKPGDIYLGLYDDADGLGDEGYTCDITDTCVIKAKTATGLRWGTVTLLQLLGAESQPANIPQGQIRDYPLYGVRGFGIDVARTAVSLDMLDQIVEEMSLYKMNDLTLHLNDNDILSTSGLTDSVENAMTAYSAFRLESDITNDKGEGLTAEDYSYSKEELNDFILRAKTYGVNVVPEIDTPAHSLAITKLFPEYALTNQAESVDQLNLDNAKARELVQSIWAEALDEDTGAFRNAAVVGIGMDEYYGDGEAYRSFLVEIQEQVQAAGKTVRLWGSLSNISGTASPAAENLQMSIWSTVWADPREMYEQGYSLINMQNNHLYIIPGGGYDYLDLDDLKDEWEPNRFYDYNELEVIPSYSPQMLGAAYMIWNDESREQGIGEEEMYERFVQPLEVIAGKLWE
jgi:hexosaminidase